MPKFTPPRCPYQNCPRFADPRERFFRCDGSYWPKCRSSPVPRFRCLTCGRGFSRQTFRADYRDHKPHLNESVVKLLCAGIGFRKSARLLGLSRRCLELKARKISRNARWLDRNLRRRAAEHCASGPAGTLRVHFDEFESYEGRRNTRPLTIAVAIESRTRFHFGAVAAPIRPGGKRTPAREAAIRRDEERFGPRRGRSRLACRIALRRAARTDPGARTVLLRTDKKSSYPRIAREEFRGRTLLHSRTSSKLPRTVRNPLFPINHEEACLRDWMGRVRRESWLVSKLRTYLNLHLGLWSAWRNWVKPRFNRDRETPGQMLGYAPRRLRPTELAGWRQDWGARSPAVF